MNPHEVLVALERASVRLEDQLRTVAELPRRAHGIAEVLQDAWPGAVLYACLLRSAEEVRFVAVDQRGQPQTDAEQRFGLPPFPEANAWDLAWFEKLNPTSRSSVLQPIAVGSEIHGFLAVLPRSDDWGGERSLLQVFLRALSRLLALRLSLEASLEDRQLLREMTQGLERLANVGELAGPLAHEFTNFLHVLLLQVTVLEFQLPEGQRADLAEIRRQGNLAAEAVSRFHQYRRGQWGSQQAVDLNRIVQEVAFELEQEPPLPSVLVACSASASSTDDSTVSLVVEQMPESAFIRGTIPDVKRLVRFLTSNAIRAAAQGGRQVTVRTEAKPGQTRLWIEDSGPTLAEQDLSRLFELSFPNREGVESLELAACKGMVRRLGGSLRAENRPDGGLCICAEFDDEVQI